MSEILMLGFAALFCAVLFLGFAYNEGLSPGGAFPIFTALLAVMAVIFMVGFVGEAAILMWQIMSLIEATT